MILKIFNLVAPRFRSCHFFCFPPSSPFVFHTLSYPRVRACFVIGFSSASNLKHVALQYVLRIFASANCTAAALAYWDEYSIAMHDRPTTPGKDKSSRFWRRKLDEDSESTWTFETQKSHCQHAKELIFWSGSIWYREASEPIISEHFQTLWSRHLVSTAQILLEKLQQWTLRTLLGMKQDLIAEC